MRRRVLRWFARNGGLAAADAQDMLTWEHGGFSLDAAVRIAGDDRAGLERLLRYCARPAFALDRLTQVNAEQVVYRLPKQQPDGRTALSPTPLELLERLAAQLVNRLAAAASPSPPLPRGAGAPCAAARRGHRPRARRDRGPRATAREDSRRVPTGRTHRALPLGDPARTAAGLGLAGATRTGACARSAHRLVSTTPHAASAADDPGRAGPVPTAAVQPCHPGRRSCALFQTNHQPAFLSHQALPFALTS